MSKGPTADSFDGLLGHLQTTKGFSRLQTQLQPALIPTARDWIEHWSELLAVDPRSAIGPLASLLADVVEWDRSHAKRRRTS